MKADNRRQEKMIKGIESIKTKVDARAEAWQKKHSEITKRLADIMTKQAALDVIREKAEQIGDVDAAMAARETYRKNAVELQRISIEERAPLFSEKEYGEIFDVIEEENDQIRAACIKAVKASLGAAVKTMSDYVEAARSLRVIQSQINACTPAAAYNKREELTTWAASAVRQLESEIDHYLYMI